jgi:hypothetical protein
VIKPEDRKPNAERNPKADFRKGWSRFDGKMPISQRNTQNTQNETMKTILFEPFALFCGHSTIAPQMGDFRFSACFRISGFGFRDYSPTSLIIYA